MASFLAAIVVVLLGFEYKSCQSNNKGDKPQRGVKYFLGSLVCFCACETQRCTYETKRAMIIFPTTTKSEKKKKRNTRQDKTRQDKTRQDKTRQDKTRQDKTRQDNRVRTTKESFFGFC
jgi:hypothetical protein